MSPVIQVLRQEHRNIARVLDALEHQVDRLAAGDRPDYELLQDIATYFCDYPDRCHHPKENAVFRQLQAKHPQVAKEIGDLDREHRDTGARAHRFRDNIQAIFRDQVMPLTTLVNAARSFIDAERQHMRMEEAVFFSPADSALSEDDWHAIGSTLSNEHDPLFGPTVEKQFAVLRDRLLAWERACSAG